MYPVGDSYETEILKNDRKTDIYGTITLTNGSVINLSKGDFAEAPAFDGQCSSDDNWSLGSVNQKQVKFTFYSDLDRYVIYDAIVDLKFALYLPDEDRWEEVPCGKYTVTECTRSGLDKLKVTALDDMDKLDVSYDGATVSGTPYDILYLISSKCGVELGQTQSEVEVLPNGSMVLGLPAKTSIQTYRDMLRDLSACLAGFGIIGRDGKLYIRNFSKVSCRTISADNRGNDTIADYKVAYSAVSCNKDGSVIAVGTNDRRLLDLEDNQFLQLGLGETVETILNNILDAVSGLEFVPASLSLLKSDPSFDLGDVVTATGYTSGTATIVPIHKMSYKWGGGQKFEAVGSDPRSGKTKSKEQKALENRLNKIAALENDVLAMQNVSEVGISSSWSQVATGSVAVSDNKKLLFHAAVRVNMESSGTIRFKYQLNGTDEDFIHEVQMPSGLHTVTLFHYVSAVSSQINRFKVFVSSPDSTGSIERLGFNGVLTGPGMIEPGFNGVIEVADTYTPLKLHRRIVPITENIIIRSQTPIPIALRDAVPWNKFHRRIVTLNDDIRLTAQAVQYMRTTEDGETRTTEEGGTRLTEV